MTAKPIGMDVGIERKAVKGKDGVHIHFYTTTSPCIISFNQSDLDNDPHPLTTERLTIKAFTSVHFMFTQKSDIKIYPTSLHVFQLWDLNLGCFLAPNRPLEKDEMGIYNAELLIRIRFKYPPSVEKHHFCEIWEHGAFFYYFAQCRHDFINDVLLHDYHCDLKEDVSTGISLVDLVRLAFEQDYDLKQLKAKIKPNYKSFLPKHVADKTKNPFVKMKFQKNFDSALDHTYENFVLTNNPLRSTMVSYLERILPSVSDYASETFQIVRHPNQSETVTVHPYRNGEAGIFITDPKGQLIRIGQIADLVKVDILGGSTVLLHFTNQSSQTLELLDEFQAESFVSLLDGFFRLSTNFHYCLSDGVFSPTVKMWNDIKSYGPISKDYLRTIWKRSESRLKEGTFLIKQRTNLFYDYLILILKMGHKIPVEVIYNPQSNSFSCPEIRVIFQSHTYEPEFRSIRELIHYYRGGDSKYFKLTSQLSPLSKEELSPGLMVCRNVMTSRRGSSADMMPSLDSEDKPVLCSYESISVHNKIYESRFFDLIEGQYNKEPVLIKQIKTGIEDRDRLTLCYQKDVQRCLAWNHDTIIRTYGICLSPFFSISQLSPGGRLIQLLKRRQESIQIQHCIQAISQIAQALVYLETHGWTHGNLRLKYVLISRFDSRGTLDVRLHYGDMTAYLATLPITDKQNLERLPWLALERWTNLKDESIESDIFSLGATIWEILSYGARPLQGFNTIEAIKNFVESGKPLPLPAAISKLKPDDLEPDNSTENRRYKLLVSVLYDKLILLNYHQDPANRMILQDVLKETIALLNRDCSRADGYNEPGPGMRSRSMSAITQSTSLGNGSSRASSFSTTQQATSIDLLSDMLPTSLPSLPSLPTPVIPNSTARNGPNDTTQSVASTIPNKKLAESSSSVLPAVPSVPLPSVPLPSVPLPSVPPITDGMRKSLSFDSRPLPSLPSQPKTPHYIIKPQNLIGLESNARKLGAGCYGEVSLCRLTGITPCSASGSASDPAPGSPGSSQKGILCAVKRLLNQSRDTEHVERAMKEFERELSTMVKLQHPNIVQLYGECFYTFMDGRFSRLIVMEYVQNGSLALFTLKKARHLPLNEKLSIFYKFSLDIAQGMRFLHSLNEGRGIIHRDLAARNVLITMSPYRAKITDFGLARCLEQKDYYHCSAAAEIPLLWCAPESIERLVFTKATDIWSYAVILWEMYSPGQKPIIPAVHQNSDQGSLRIDTTHMLQLLNDSGPGKRLPKPADMQSTTYNLMMRCWYTEPIKRPSFDDIIRDLERDSFSFQDPW